MKFSTLQMSSILSAFFLATDQIIKASVQQSQSVLDWVLLRIMYVENTGASFGMLKDNNSVFIWISLIVIGSAIAWYDRIPQKALPWAIIIGGGIMSNLIDRIFRGFVIDYIDFGWWPVFNIGDSMIVVGTITLIILFWKK